MAVVLVVLIKTMEQDHPTLGLLMEINQTSN